MRDYNHIHSGRTERDIEQQSKVQNKSLGSTTVSTLVQHTARGSTQHFKNMQCMWEAEPLQSSMLEVLGMHVSAANTLAAQTCAQHPQRGGSHCVKQKGVTRIFTVSMKSLMFRSVKPVIIVM